VTNYLRLPLLGVIPTATSERGSGYGYGRFRGTAATATTPKEVAAQLNPDMIRSWALLEAYRTLRTSIVQSSADRSTRTILVTSAYPREGKTTTTVNLGITLAQLGKRVLLIDSDMRKPRIADLLKVAPKPGGEGLSTHLVGQFGSEESIVPTVIPNIFVLPCGPIPPNPPELLSSKAMCQLLSEAKEKFDFVLLDSPPLLLVSDARILASLVDAVILVAHGAQTSRIAVSQARWHLFQANAHVIGVALNNMDLSKVGYMKYYS